MRGAVLTEINKPLQILDLEQEPPKSKEVRVRVKAAGVCMSDWHIMNGDWPLPLPMVLGHEAAGIVVDEYLKLALAQGWAVEVREIIDRGACGVHRRLID